jgi:hypothetical protein
LLRLVKIIHYQPILLYIYKERDNHMIPENGITCESFKRKKKSSNKNAA